MSGELLDKKLRQLTPDEQEQVLKLIDGFLENKEFSRAQQKPGFSWAGGLANLKDQYTSIKLQEKINEWW